MGVAAALSCLLAGPGRAAFEPIQGDRNVVFDLSDRVTYDDNLFRVPPRVIPGYVLPGPGTSTSDVWNSASVGMNGQWVYGRQAFEAALNAVDNRFDHNTALNNVSGAEKLVWDWQLGNQLYGQLGGDYSRGLTDFANTQFYSKDLISTTGYFGMATWDLGPHWRLDGTVKHAVTTHTADVRKGDDFEEKSGDFGVEYAVSSVDSFGLHYQYSKAAFAQQQTLDGLPFNRNYDDNTFSLKLKYALGALTHLEASAGYLERKYPDATAGNATVGNFSGDIWSASVQWQPTIQTGLKLSGWRDLRAYLDAESNYFVSRGAMLTPIWSPLERLDASMELSRETEDFVGSTAATLAQPGRRDTLTAGKLIVAYRPRRRLQVDLSYRFEKRTSNTPSVEYRDKLASVRLRYRF